MSVAIELARRMVAGARDSAERGTAANLLGTALRALGEREAGTARLEEAVATFRAALQERTREHTPLDWAYSRHGLAEALAALAKRQRKAALMEQALACMGGAIEVYRQGRVTHWLPAAQRRVGETEAASADLKG